MQESVPQVLFSFARSLGADVQGHRLTIPSKFGSGYCAGYVFNEHIRMLISDYELSKDMLIHNPEVNKAGQMIFFKFQHIFPKVKNYPPEKKPRGGSSVLIGTSLLNTAGEISIHTNTSTINIEVDADYLSGLFGMPERSPILKSLLRNDQPLLFEQLVQPSLGDVVEQMLTEDIDPTFQLFFLRIKAEELIYRLLIALDKRDEQRLYPLNGHDIDIIYKIRETMLDHLDTPPAIKDMAAEAGMSPTKLKRLFKQIFGDSIFSYYQQFRMKEAARLLMEERISVSDAGYRMGFTNLSHFTRVFEEHMGMKPKRYSLMK